MKALTKRIALFLLLVVPIFLSLNTGSSSYGLLLNELSDAEIAGDSATVVDISIKLSEQEYKHGNYPLSLEYLIKAESYATKISQEVSILIKKGFVYSKQNNLKKANYYAEKANRVSSSLTNADALPNLYVLKGEIAYGQLRYNLAYEFALKALVFFQEINDEKGQLKVLDLLSRVYYEQNKLQLALDCGRQYVVKSKKQNMAFELAQAYTSMAMVFGKLNNADSADVFINKAFEISKKEGALSQMVNVYNTLYQLNEMYGQPKEALVYFKKYTELKYSLTGQNKAREIAQLEAVQEAQKQREVNGLLEEKSVLQEATISQKELESKLYIIGLSLFVLLGVFAVYSLNRARSANRKLLRLTSEMRESRDNIKNTSEKLKQTNRKLVKIQAALISQKDTAERASSAKDVFLSSVTHELRTPLTAILGLSEEMLSETENAKTRDNLEVIKFSGESLLSLVNDILDFNKIQSGRIELEQISFNLKGYLDKVVRALKPRARQNNVHLNFKYDEKLPDWLIADPTRLGQVINNFLSNAIKFTENGNVDLILELVERKADQYFVKFSVMDEGIGIPKDKHELIFERFAQASTETTRKYGGTGLGLAISKRIVELYGATIKLESEIGKGSCFSFIMKLEKGYPIVEVVDVQGDLPQEINILLVEDNRINQKLVAKTFSNIGIDIDITSNGLEAVELLRSAKKEYDVILMDLHMPKMDGIEATRIIRQMDGYFQNMPIIGLSGSTLKERHELIEMGLSAFMQKPFKRDELLKLVAEQIVKA